MTTDKRLKQFRKIVKDAVEECWDESIYDENTPPETYDYKANDEKEPESIDPDNDLYDDLKYPRVAITIREKMAMMSKEYFYPGWERDAKVRRQKDREEDERLERLLQEQDDEETADDDNNDDNGE